MATSNLRQARVAYRALPASTLHVRGELDLRNRERTSLFPWRGQFSPDLVRLLLRAHEPGRVLDPFMGSGTVLYEAARAGWDSAGSEINPAAFLFARLAEVAVLPELERRHCLRSVEQWLCDSFGLESSEPVGGDLLGDAPHDSHTRQLLEASFLLACGNKSECTHIDLLREFSNVRVALEGVKGAGAEALAVPADARYLPFEAGSFDLTITSPPYINVFNYHQQFRTAVEALGYSPLRIATSEIGANRKHRQNRFMTVIQYCLDMSLALDEIARLLKKSGTLVLVIGRESRVRGLAIDNGALIYSLLAQRDDLMVTNRDERKFTSRFGGLIFEDLLFVRRTGSDHVAGDLGSAREVGSYALKLVRADADEADVRQDLEQAIITAPKIAPSPRVVAEAGGLSTRCLTQTRPA